MANILSIKLVEQHCFRGSISLRMSKFLGVAILQELMLLVVVVVMFFLSVFAGKLILDSSSVDGEKVSTFRKNSDSLNLNR